MVATGLPAMLRTPDDRFAGLPGWPYAPHADMRVVAPDLIGCGRPDRPVDDGTEPNSR